MWKKLRSRTYRVLPPYDSCLRVPIVTPPWYPRVSVLAVGDSQTPRLSSTWGQHQSLPHLPSSDHQEAPVRSGGTRYNSPVPECADGEVQGLESIPPPAGECDAEHRTDEGNCRNA